MLQTNKSYEEIVELSSCTEHLKFLVTNIENPREKESLAPFLRSHLLNLGHSDQEIDAEFRRFFYEMDEGATLQ